MASPMNPIFAKHRLEQYQQKTPQEGVGALFDNFNTLYEQLNGVAPAGLTPKVLRAAAGSDELTFMMSDL